MQLILGVLFHFIGGFASGSFYIPYKRVRAWAWESFWIVGGIFSWAIMPPLAAWITIPGFATIIHQADTRTLAATYIFGLLWGIGGLTYGLGVRYLGVALGSSVILGLCSVFGALIPSVYYDIFPAAGKDSFTLLLHTHWGQLVLAGILICLAGIMISGRAGMLKERELGALKKADAGAAADQDEDAVFGARDVAMPQTPATSDYNFRLGILVAIVSGVLSACFAFGIDAGKAMAGVADAVWKSAHPGRGEFLFQNNITYVVLLWGGLTTNLTWCMILNARNRTFSDYTARKTPLLSNYLFSALAGTTWFLQFFFYGMGESKLGNGASSWILHMAFIILVANVWGLVLREWKGVSRKALQTLLIGIATIILSVVVVGYGNSIKP